MKNFIKCIFCIALLSSSALSASPLTVREAYIEWLNINVDANLSVIDVKPSCYNTDGSTIRNCIEDGQTLNVWLDYVRRPNASNPVEVNIAAGSYDYMYIKMKCDPANGYTGYTSFTGAGSTITTLKVNQNPITINNCTQLAFSDFAVETFYHYINWTGGGDSRWSDMDIRTQGGVWREHTCGATRGKHYWYSSKLSFGAAGNGLGYTATCDETWFYGSEIAFGGGFFAHANGHALSAQGAGEIHVYGSNISGKGTQGDNSGLIKAANGGKIHIHGTGIDLKPSATALGTASVFKAESGGTIHANSNAFAIDFSSTADISRISELGGNVTSPYNWGALIEPPLVTSKTGSDIVIETDCSATICDDAGSQPHTLIYDASCASNVGGPWLDTTTQACRGE